MRLMTTGQLRELIAHVPNGTPVLVPAPDHSYRQVGKHGAVVTTALTDGSRLHWSEDHFDDELEKGEQRVRVLVIL